MRDIVMVVGIEMKAIATVRATDFGGLKMLADACEQKFAFGIVLYDPRRCRAFSDRLTAVSLSCLWR
ncbi:MULTISPECIES: hypothetical protein [unclassified Rhizobium]|uniref:hypothetical protein n=1 Tax=unclassified Rhizobium TaxID=2613769 RepID=UPI0011AB6E70|nr:MULTISPECIES: hypothetical protein [unclassified Rhizobium]